MSCLLTASPHLSLLKDTDRETIAEQWGRLLVIVEHRQSAMYAMNARSGCVPLTPTLKSII